MTFRPRSANSKQTDPAGPDWLEAVLTEEYVLRAAARAAEAPDLYGRSAEVALAITRLNRARDRIGFAAMPLVDYITNLGAQIGQPTEKVLNWAGLQNRPTANPSSAPLLARLGQAVGFSIREVLVMVRLQLLGEAGHTLPGPVAAYRTTPGPPIDPLIETERALDALAGEIGEACPGDLGAVEDAVRQAFSTPD